MSKKNKEPEARYYRAEGGMGNPKIIKSTAQHSEVIVCHFPSSKWERYTSDRPYPDDTGEGLTEITEAEWLEYYNKSELPKSAVK